MDLIPILLLARTIDNTLIEPIGYSSIILPTGHITNLIKRIIRFIPCDDLSIVNLFIVLGGVFLLGVEIFD